MRRLQGDTLRRALPALALALPLAAGLATAAGSSTTTAPAAAATTSTTGTCPTRTTGVTVVVGSNVRCAPGDPTSALAALEASGHSTVMVQRFPGALCRIDGRPRPAKDACVQMPPASAYWAFYTAPRGGSWTYAPVGVTSWDPEPGTVVGFAYGAGARPGVRPPR